METNRRPADEVVLYNLRNILADPGNLPENLQPALRNMAQEVVRVSTESGITIEQALSEVVTAESVESYERMGIG